MKPTKNTKKGFSLIELILVIFLIGISLGLSLLYLETAQVREDINKQAEVFTSNVRLAHSDALSGLNNQAHGVHLEQSSYTIFSGNTYDPNDSANFETELPPNMTIENINLNGGGSDILFTSPNGETLNFGTLDFVSNKVDRVITINVTKLGTVTY